MICPKPDPLVESLFASVLAPPKDYEYYFHNDEPQLLYPVHGQDKWRLLLRKRGTQDLVPVFIEGKFMLGLTKALNAMQRELNQSVSEEIGEPNSARIS